MHKSYKQNQEGYLPMKLTVLQSPEIAETEIAIRCSYVSKDLQRVISLIHSIDTVLIGYHEKMCFRISIDSVFYIDSVENQTFIYTNNNTYNCKERLYELDVKLKNMDFVRISKNTIVNLRQISQVKSVGISKLELVLKNKEKLIVNRNYLKEFKQRFGI